MTVRTEKERDVYSVVTQAYDAQGMSLIDTQGPTFDGEYGIRILCRQGEVEAEVVISPFKADSRKKTTGSFVEGEPVELYNPVTKEPLSQIPELHSDSGGDYYVIYLTPQLDKGEMIAITNIWGNSESQVLEDGDWLKLLS